jgi:hypothetical protein
MADSQCRLALKYRVNIISGTNEAEAGDCVEWRGWGCRLWEDMRTLPSLVSSIVRRPTSCPCLSPETWISPWSSSRKNSDEPSRARADGSAGSAPLGEDLGGSVRGMIIARQSGIPRTRRVNLPEGRVTWCQIHRFVRARLFSAVFSTSTLSGAFRENSFLSLPPSRSQLLN